MAKSRASTTSMSEAETEATMWGNDEFEFHGQRPGETVMAVTRQHATVILPPILIATIMSLLPILSLMYFGASRITSIILGAYLIFAIWHVGTKLYLFLESVNLITNQRVIVARQLSIFRRKITEAELDRIQDVSTEINGIGAMLFGYGDVLIRTASSDTLIKLHNIPAPYDTQQTIVRLVNELKRPAERRAESA